MTRLYSLELVILSYMDGLLRELFSFSTSHDQMALFRGFHNEHAMEFRETDHAIVFILRNCVR